MSEKAFIRNIALLLIVNLLIKPIYLFGIDAQVQNAVGPEIYGVYFALFNFAFLFQIILDPGIQNFNSKWVSQERERVNEIFPQVFASKLILASIFMILCLIAAYFIYPFIYLKQLGYLICIQICSSFFLYFRSHLNALGLFRKDVWFSGLDKLLMILLIGYFLLYESINIQLFIELQLIALIFANIILILYLRSHIKINLRWSFPEFKQLLKKAFPFALVFLLMTLYTRIDGVMLERLLNDNGKEAGIYAAAYRILDAANMMGVLFATLLLPMFARLLTDVDQLSKLSNTALRIILFLSALILLSSLFYAEDLLSLIYINLNDKYFICFRLLMISFLALSISYIYGTMITSSGELRVFNWIFIVGIIINWGLNLYLIPIYQATGAAVATVFTQFIVMLGQTSLAFKKFKLRPDLALILKYFTLFSLGILCFYLIKEYSSLMWVFNLMISVVLLSIVSILLGFVRSKWVFGMAFE